jgi:hypothetical protein
MAFFDRYLEVVPNVRLVWTNREATPAHHDGDLRGEGGKTLL